MVDKTIPDLPMGVAALLDHPFESVEDGISVKLTLAQMRGVAVVPIVTGAVPVDIGPDAFIASVTSGGTAGAEIINILAPPLDIDGYYNADYLGTQITIILTTQTDPADVVTITNDGAASVQLFPEGFIETGAIGYADVRLNFLGAAVTYVWIGDNWALYYAATDGNFTGAQDFGDISLVTDVSHNINVRSQDGFINVQAQSAGEVIVRTDSGNLRIETVSGNIVVTGLPAADPGVTGALWADPITHILKVSP